MDTPGKTVQGHDVHLYPSCPLQTLLLMRPQVSYLANRNVQPIFPDSCLTVTLKSVISSPF